MTEKSSWTHPFRLRLTKSSSISLTILSSPWRTKECKKQRKGLLYPFEKKILLFRAEQYSIRSRLLKVLRSYVEDSNAGKGRAEGSRDQLEKVSNIKILKRESFYWWPRDELETVLHIEIMKRESGQACIEHSRQILHALEGENNTNQPKEVKKWKFSLTKKVNTQQTGIYMHRREKTWRTSLTRCSQRRSSGKRWLATCKYYNKQWTMNRQEIQLFQAQLSGEATDGDLSVAWKDPSSKTAHWLQGYTSCKVDKKTCIHNFRLQIDQGIKFVFSCCCLRSDLMKRNDSLRLFTIFIVS